MKALLKVLFCTSLVLGAGLGARDVAAQDTVAQQVCSDIIQLPEAERFSKGCGESLPDFRFTCQTKFATCMEAGETQAQCASQAYQAAEQQAMEYGCELLALPEPSPPPAETPAPVVPPRELFLSGGGCSLSAVPASGGDALALLLVLAALGARRPSR